MTGTGEPALPEHLRRRLDAVFGDVLPDVTRDEVAEPGAAESTDAGATEAGPDPRGPGSAASGRDAWLHANRPPHHDDRD